MIDEQTIQTDLENAERYKEKINKDIAKWIGIYNGEPYGNENQYRSTIVWKLVKKHGEILIANLIKPFLSGSDLIRLEPRTQDDVYKAELDNKLLNFFFNKKFDKSKFIKQLVRVMVKEGTAFVKVSWDIKNKCPYAEVLYNEDIFTDPDAYTIQDSKFFIHRFKTTVSDLESNPIYNKEAINKFKKLISDSKNDTYASSDDMHLRELDNYERVKDNEVFLYEYWFRGKDNNIYISSFVKHDTTLLVLSEEKYEFNEYPFVDFPFYNNEFSIWGNALADIIEDEQKFMTSIVRGVIDNMAMSNNGQKFVRKGALDAVNMQNLLNGKPIVEINTTDHISTAVIDGHFNELPSSVYNLLQVIENQAEGLTGVSKFMQGLVENPNSTATFTQTIMSQSQIRLLDIEDNIIRGLKFVFYHWVQMIVNYLDEKEILKITGTTIAEEKAKMIERFKKQYQLEAMPPETQQKAIMLIMHEVEKIFDTSTINYDFKLKIGTDASNQVKINQINMLMQQAAPLVQAQAVPPIIIKKLISKLFDLFDYPDLAEEIIKFEPQPSELEIQMSQLQLEKLKGEAQKEQALAQNAIARAQNIMTKSKKEQMSIEPEIAAKYTEVAKKAKELNKSEMNNDNNRKSKKPIQ